MSRAVNHVFQYFSSFTLTTPLYTLVNDSISWPRSQRRRRSLWLSLSPASKCSAPSSSPHSAGPSPP